ncbi:MAG: CopG family transcriptional regulator [Acidimicrobiales bacterium]
MTKLTIELDDEVAKRVLDAAAERGVAPEAVAAEAVSERFPSRRRLSFIGMGHSGRTDTARRHDEILRDYFVDKAARDV